MVNKEVVVNDLKGIIKSIKLDARKDIKELDIKHGIFSSFKVVWEDEVNKND